MRIASIKQEGFRGIRAVLCYDQCVADGHLFFLQSIKQRHPPVVLTLAVDAENCFAIPFDGIGQTKAQLAGFFKSVLTRCRQRAGGKSRARPGQ